MGCAEVTMSRDNPADDGYITVAKKHHGAISPVTSSENNKTGRKSRTAMYGGAKFLSPACVFQKGSKLKLYLFHDFSRNAPRVTMKTP
jgi:hypothetical protein